MVERNAARSSAWLALHLSLTFSWHIAAHHAKFLSSFFCKCILQGAIDFAKAAEAEWEAWSGCRTFFGVAGFAHKPNFSRSTSQPTVQIFKHLFLHVHSANCN